MGQSGDASEIVVDAAENTVLRGKCDVDLVQRPVERPVFWFVEGVRGKAMLCQVTDHVREGGKVGVPCEQAGFKQHKLAMPEGSNRAVEYAEFTALGIDLEDKRRMRLVLRHHE